MLYSRHVVAKKGVNWAGNYDFGSRLFLLDFLTEANGTRNKGSQKYARILLLNNKSRLYFGYKAICFWVWVLILYHHVYFLSKSV